MSLPINTALCVAALFFLVGAPSVNAQVDNRPPYVPYRVTPRADPNVLRAYVEALNQQTQGNEERFMRLLAWVYELKPQVIDDPILFRELEEYQSILERLQSGGYASGEDTLLAVELGIQRSLSNAKVRARGGASGDAAGILRQRQIEDGWLNGHAALLSDALILEERFESNRLGWQTAPSQGETVSMAPGAYTVGATDRDWHSFTAPVPQYANATNYAIEALLKLGRFYPPEGPPACGLIWGMKDNDNYNAFLINTDQLSVAIIRETQGHRVTLAEASGVEAVRSGSRFNRLGITKNGDYYVFTINGVIVASAEAENLHGNEVGFWVGPKQTVIANSLLIGAQ